MNLKSWIALIVVFVISLIWSVDIYALDVGSSIYSRVFEGKTSMEVFYESYERKIEMPQEGVDISENDQKEDRVVARLNMAGTEKVIIHLDLGLTDSDESKGYEPLFGGGFIIRAYSNSINVDVFGSGYYVPEIKYEDSGYDSKGRYFEYSQEENYFEIGGGIALSKEFELDRQFSLIPYGGIFISILEGDEDYEYNWPGLGKEVTDGEITNEGLLNLFLGVGVQIGHNWGIRVEGRFVEESSVSAGVLLGF